MAAMAAGAEVILPATVIDVSLHHALAATLDAAPGIHCSRVQTYADCGRLAVQTAWAAHIADQFVRETRYDPLHDGVSEQQLYEQLEAWQARLDEHESLTVELTRNGTAYQVVLDRSALITADRARWQPLLAHLADDPRVLLTTRAVTTPGLQAALADHAAGTLDPADVARGVEANIDVVTRNSRTDDGGYRLIDELPYHRAAAESAAPRRSRRSGPQAGAPSHHGPAGNRATHLLAGSKAWAITEEVLHVGRNGGGGRWAELTGLPAHLCDLQRVGGVVELRNVHPSGTLINGVLVTDRHAVAAGDRIIAPETGVELLAIEVEPGVS